MKRREATDDRPILVTFGLGGLRWRLAAQRLARQSRRSGWFSAVELWTTTRIEHELPEFWREHSDFIKACPRGAGYWIWRPAIILHTLSGRPLGTNFVFLDAGCELNVSNEAREQFQSYVARAELFGMAVMETEEPSTRWVKPELIEAARTDGLDPLNHVLEAGVLFATSSQRAIELSSAWLHWCTRGGYRFVDDSSWAPRAEASEFVDHRHDGAVLTCLLPVEMTVPHASFFPGEWLTRGRGQPIWACRNTTPILLEQPTFTSAVARGLRAAWHRLKRYVNSRG